MELLNSLICSPYTHERKHLGPGQIIMRLPQTQRDILKTLTSEEVQNTRFDAVWGTKRDTSPVSVRSR